MNTRYQYTSGVTVLLALFLSLLHQSQCDFAYFKNKFGDILEITGGPTVSLYGGLSAIRHNDPDKNDIKRYYIGHTQTDQKKGTVAGSVINLKPEKGNAQIELWANNLPLFPLQHFSSPSFSALSAKIHASKLPFEELANFLHENPVEYENHLRGGQQQQPLYANGVEQSYENAKLYMEGNKIITVNGLKQPDGYGFIISKEDGSAIVGFFEEGISKYHHKFQLSGKHEYYKQNVCSGNASEMTETMLWLKTGIKHHSYSYCPNKIELCRAIAKDEKAPNSMISFGEKWECLGSIHLGVLDGIGIMHVKQENKYIAGMWLLGHPTTPRIEVVESSFVFVGVEDPSEYEEEAKFVRGLAGQALKFTNELHKLAIKVCEKHGKKDPSHKAK